jgi:hypothetical protein
MAHHQWITLRANRIQGDMLAECETAPLALRNLPLMIRYQTTAERAFHKAHTELVKAQKQSPNLEIGFESQNASEPVAATPETTPESAPEPAAPAPESPAPLAPTPIPPKPATSAPAKVSSLADFKSQAELMEWARTATLDELCAIGV